MSRIGRLPVDIPAGVTVTVDENNTVVVTNGKNTISQPVNKCINVEIKDNQVVCTRSSEENKVKAMHGLYRTLINNAIVGLTKGFEKTLIISGVGAKVQKVGNKVVMNINFSHPVEVEETEGVTLTCPTATEIKVSGYSKEAVGALAAKIRAVKPVEPYHGYGIRYSDEVVILKQGKTTAKK
ncbi:MAG: 50S ribosomal protein L6 [Clostridia bacterium]